MQELFDGAFARHGRAALKRQELAKCWASYIDVHPWDIDVRNVDPCTLDIFAVLRQPAPIELALVFSEWLAAIRFALENGLYALAATRSGQDPPPQAARLQFPICSSPTDFKRQSARLRTLHGDVLEALEECQPYRSPYGPESNLLYWIHELSRTDRHRSLHIGLGRVDEHSVRVASLTGAAVSFDEKVDPFSHIDGELVLARVVADQPLGPFDISADLRGVYIAPEITAWAGFRLNGRPQSLQDRMVYTEIFTRGHLENMAAMGGATPPDGFRAIELDPASDG